MRLKLSTYRCNPNMISIVDTKSLSQHYLNTLYHHVEKPKMKSSDQDDISETYGEILYPGIDKILSQIKLTSDDVFVDLGSGFGKAVIQVFLQSHVQEAYGIEKIPQLHQKAKTAASVIQQDLTEFYEGDRKLDFILGDFLEVSLQQATVVLICSPCYSQKTLMALEKILNETPSIHTIFSLRPMFSLQRLSFKKTLRIECSWDSALCYVYAK